MKTINFEDLSINFLLCDAEGAFYRLHSLLKGGDAVPVEAWEYDKIAFLGGGLELIADKHFIFFQSLNFVDLDEAVHFVLLSLNLLGDLKNPGWQNYLQMDIGPDHSFGRDLPGNERISFEKSNLLPFKVGISYSSNERMNEKRRNDFYFDTIWIPEESWIRASRIALNEYFQFLKLVKSIGDPQSEVHQKSKKESLWEEE